MKSMCIYIYGIYQKSYQSYEGAHRYILLNVQEDTLLSWKIELLVVWINDHAFKTLFNRRIFVRVAICDVTDGKEIIFYNKQNIFGIKGMDSQKEC